MLPRQYRLPLNRVPLRRQGKVMLRSIATAILALLCVTQCGWTQTGRVDGIHYVRPGENPQSVLDAAVPGEKLVFLPGVHTHPLRKHQSLLYVDKSIDIELMEGSVLKLADGQTTLQLEPELSIDHGAPKTLNDFSVGGTYDGGIGPVIFTVKIDGEGRDGRPDTFSWTHGWGPGATRGVIRGKIPITGDWQPLSHGIEVRFDALNGHSHDSFWALSYDGRESYGIRVGYGTQEDTIEDVRIYGRGTIDMNRDNNVQPSELVRNISASVLLHGRVRNVSVEQITMINAFRSVMAYGEHTGKFLRGGGTQGGESFDAENISIIGTRTLNPEGKAYLLGHPSHRGRLTNLRCNYNYMETHATALEPNFNLSQYEVVGNVIKSGGRAIHCWRKSTDGIIKNNVRLADTTGRVPDPPDHQSEVVMVNSPGAWEDPENLILRDNRNYLHDTARLGYWASQAGGFENGASGSFSTVAGGRHNTASGELAAVTGGDSNHASGRGSAITGGVGNSTSAPFARAHGSQASATRFGEEVVASGAFGEAGDAQTSLLVAKALTTDSTPTRLASGDHDFVTLRKGSSVGYRILAAARSGDGSVQALYEAKGLAECQPTGKVLLHGNSTSVIHKSDRQLRLHVDARAESLVVEVHGLPNSSIRWVARIELVEVGF